MVLRLKVAPGSFDTSALDVQGAEVEGVAASVNIHSLLSPYCSDTRIITGDIDAESPRHGLCTAHPS